ncbi:MAG: metallophosphoesterase [Steroidobacteraceae bacterium]|jgi:calcineurin-like phosphoesterase family protein
MFRHAYLEMALALAGACALGGCFTASDAKGPHAAAAAVSDQPAATFSVPAAALHLPLVLVAYGDMRFTNPAETSATSPSARRALVAKVAAERPQAIFLNGDVPWHGISADYDVFRTETAPWREQQLRVYPALGNHEFSKCEESQCLEYWWNTFGELRGRRWYSVALGGSFLAVLLDSDSSLLPRSEQRVWLEQQFSALGRHVQFVLIVLHHPPVADIQTTKEVDHNPRPNEQALAAYLDRIAPALHARILVSAGHTHNYERQQRSGVTYLVSGGGGAKPYEIDRTAEDLYQATDFPNYHYVRLELTDGRLSAEMIRLADPAAGAPGQWEIRDRFDLSPRP